LDILIMTAAERLPGMADQLRHAHEALEQAPELPNGLESDPED
jgi:hypothetical protein